MPHRLFALALSLVCSVVALDAYDKPPLLPSEAWEAAQPYLLPEDHPIKASLDAIFPTSAPLLSTRALKKRGFWDVTVRRSGIIVAAHPHLEGYRLKIYLHDFHAPEWGLFLTRIRGAEVIRETIRRHHLQPYLKVPHKWLYPVHPDADIPADSLVLKHFVLVVEDAEPLDRDDNFVCYRDVVDKRQLKALYTVLSELLLIDSIYVDNIPVCSDGRIAFVDTEHYLVTHLPMRYDRMDHIFSPKMQRYWKKLTGRATP